MIDIERWEERIKKLNNYVLCFILFYTGVALSSLFNMLKPAEREERWLEWSESQDLDKMKNMY